MELFNSLLNGLGVFFSKTINYWIIAFFVFEIFAYSKSKSNKKEIENAINNWEKDNDLFQFDENGKIQKCYDKLNFWYTIFITIITVFPLLGMLGTVSSLLVIDTSSSEALSNAQESFFSALSSTFLGIIFAISFKILNAAKLYDIEDIAQRLLKVIKTLRQESIDEAKKQKSGWRI
ncbi:MotA/TolQ/ExbB proton channel family protein [Ruminococcus flavefaciens]|uniref:MotA/TolQ/ExbB proton channel family protein n=1 Tax=Ruminococcus flavefaciens TaxID=1265 RepID=UPI0026F1D6B6|nr:MotA/TolQ/ExbB proton channel family protein [Ruminococcus flavefaciens]